MAALDLLEDSTDARGRQRQLRDAFAIVAQDRWNMDSDGHDSWGRLSSLPQIAHTMLTGQSSRLESLPHPKQRCDAPILEDSLLALLLKHGRPSHLPVSIIGPFRLSGFGVRQG